MANLGESVGRARKTEFLAALLELAPDEQVFEAKAPVEPPKVEAVHELLREPEPEAVPEPAPTPQPPTRSLNWAAPQAPAPEAEQADVEPAEEIPPPLPMADELVLADLAPEAPLESTVQTETEFEPEAMSLAQSAAWASQPPADSAELAGSNDEAELEAELTEEAAAPASAPLMASDPEPAVSMMSAPPIISQAAAPIAEPEAAAEDTTWDAQEELDEWAEPPAPAPRSAVWYDAVEPPASAPKAEEPEKPIGKLDWLKGLGRKIGLSKSSHAEQPASEPEPELETWTLEEPKAPVAAQAAPPQIAPEQMAMDQAEQVEAPALAGEEPTGEAPAAPSFDWLKSAELDAEAAPAPAVEAAPLLQVEAAEAPVMAVEAEAAEPAPAAPKFDWLKAADAAPSVSAAAPPVLPQEEPEAAAEPAAEPEPAPEAPKFDWLKAADAAPAVSAVAPPALPLEEPEAAAEPAAEPEPAPEAPKLGWPKAVDAEPMVTAAAPPILPQEEQEAAAELAVQPEPAPEAPKFGWLKAVDAAPAVTAAAPPVVPQEEPEMELDEPEAAIEAEPAPEAPKFDWSKVAAAESVPEWKPELAVESLEETAPVAMSPFSRAAHEPEPIHTTEMKWEESESEPDSMEPPMLHITPPFAQAGAPSAPEPSVPQIFEQAEAPTLDTAQASMAKSYRWKRLGDLLVDLGVITTEQLTEALQLQKVGKKPLGQTLVENGFITEALLLKTLAAQYDVELWELENAEPSAAVARMLPEALCRERSMIAVARREDGIVVAMKNPADLEGLEEVQRITGMEAIPALASAERIESYISEIFNPIAQMKAMQEKSGVEVTNDQEFDVRVEPDGSVVQMVDELLEMAIKMKVSDVHIEPREKMVEVRVRLDGQLIKIKEYSKAIAPMLTARFKIMAEVDLVEWRIPQDGRISIKCDGRVVDMRVSILPSLYGQRIVMRLLDKSNALRKLDDLGFSQHNLVLFRKLINRPYGLFLVTGPTGSGKTTTLYAALNEIRKPTNNVMTCEDPVEYDIHGINQSQVNEKVGLTFGSQLRAILRQDPDIVLVGEIRDRETAEIAIKASMTGHMVLSTLHTNDAPGALPRLLDMGVDASNLSTALVGAMGQRLIRRLCPHCREDSAPTPDEIELLENSFGSTDLAKLWRPVGCPKCHGQGYKGRMAIHEIMPVTSESAELVQQRAPIERIREVVRYYGYRTMQEDSLDRIVNGVTSLDEAKRILSFDDVPRLENPEAYYKKLQKSA